MTTITESVIIVNFNAGRLLSDCIHALRDAAPDAEIMVVDNGSEDDSLANLPKSSNADKDPISPPSKQKYPSQEQLKIARNLGNRGFAVAVNQGIEATTGQNIVVLNPDCVVQADVLVKLRRVLEANPTVGMVGPLIVNPDGTEQEGCRRRIPTPWRSFVRAFGLTRLGRRWPRWFADFSLRQDPLPGQPVAVEAISGACMYLRRAALKQVGLLDEGYFLHCEDLDWCMRFYAAGWKILFVPDAVVVHYQGTCSKRRPIRVEWHKHRGMLRFHNKFFRPRYPVVVTGLIWVGTWLHFALVSGYYLLRHGWRRVRYKHD